MDISVGRVPRMGDFPGTIDQMGSYFNQMSRALNTIGDNQKAMAANMKTMADNQQTMAEDITTLIVRSKRQDAVHFFLSTIFVD